MGTIVTARVLYVNYPETGKRFGSIKLDHQDVRYVSCKPGELAQFAKGQVYTIEVSENDRDGKRYYNLVKIASYAAFGASPPTTTGTLSNTQPTRGVSGNPGASDYTTGKQIAVTGIVQRAVQNGACKVEEVPRLMRLVANTFDEIFNPKPVAVAPEVDRRTYVTPARDHGQHDVPFDDDPYGESRERVPF